MLEQGVDSRASAGHSCRNAPCRSHINCSLASLSLGQTLRLRLGEQTGSDVHILREGSTVACFGVLHQPAESRVGQAIDASGCLQGVQSAPEGCGLLAVQVGLSLQSLDAGQELRVAGQGPAGGGGLASARARQLVRKGRGVGRANSPLLGGT